MAMSFSPLNPPCSSSESESDNDFETEELSVHQAVGFLPYDEELEPLATEEEAAEYDATIEQQQELEWTLSRTQFIFLHAGFLGQLGIDNSHACCGTILEVQSTIR